MTKGLKSSEGWAAIAGIILTALNDRLGLGLTTDQLQTIAIIVAGYAVSRGIAKHGVK